MHICTCMYMYHTHPLDLCYNHSLFHTARLHAFIQPTYTYMYTVSLCSLNTCVQCHGYCESNALAVHKEMYLLNSLLTESAQNKYLNSIVLTYLYVHVLWILSVVQSVAKSSTRPGPSTSPSPGQAPLPVLHQARLLYQSPTRPGSSTSPPPGQAPLPVLHQARLLYQSPTRPGPSTSPPPGQAPLPASQDPLSH